MVPFPLLAQKVLTDPYYQQAQRDHSVQSHLLDQTVH